MITAAFKYSNRKRSSKGNNLDTNSVSSRKSPSPLYEEIPETHFHNIDLAKNDAYGHHSEATPEPMYYNQTSAENTV